MMVCKIVNNLQSTVIYLLEGVACGAFPGDLNRMTSESLQSVLALPASRGLSVDIATRLRAAIFAGHFGPGERLREEALARAMGVSRGPIREALSQLEREGLIVIKRNRGAFVARLSREDLDEVYTLRVAVERLAVQRACEVAEPAEIAELDGIVRQMAEAISSGCTEQEAAELDLHFHDVIYQAAHHRRLYECWTNLRPQIHIVLLSRNVAHPDFRLLSVAVDSHQELVDAIRTKNVEAAGRLIEDHLLGSYERTIVGYGWSLDEPKSELLKRAGGNE
jgi:DNA-binding GntR family transcriptional regulator